MATLNAKKPSDSLYRRLRLWAKAERRSVTQEVAEIPEAAMTAREPLSLMELRGLGREVWRGEEAAKLVAEERRAWGQETSGTYGTPCAGGACNPTCDPENPTP